MLSLKKITQDTTKSVYEYIPMQNFTESYDDKKLYKEKNMKKKLSKKIKYTNDYQYFNLPIIKINLTN